MKYEIRPLEIHTDSVKSWNRGSWYDVCFQHGARMDRTKICHMDWSWSWSTQVSDLYIVAGGDEIPATLMFRWRRSYAHTFWT